MLIAPTVLSLPRQKETSEIYTAGPNAYDRKIVSFSLQDQPVGHDKMIGYWSRSPTDFEDG